MLLLLSNNGLHKQFDHDAPQIHHTAAPIDNIAGVYACMFIIFRYVVNDCIWKCVYTLCVTVCGMWYMTNLDIQILYGIAIGWCVSVANIICEVGEIKVRRLSENC